MDCEATPANLAALLAFVDQACQDAGLDEDTRFAVRLAGEEAICNIVHHAYEGMPPGPVSLHLYRDGAQVVLEVQDRAPVFSPDDAPPPDLSSDVNTRRLGGLGWHLIRQFMDEVRHEAVAGGGNRLALVKRMQPQPAPAP